MASSLAYRDGQMKVSKRVEKELHNTKVVVRRLPPDMTEAHFFELFTDIPDYSYFYFTAGDPTFGELATSRAYFSFTEESSIVPFRDKYDGILLESAKGYKYRAVIEFAPYQGIPKRMKRKTDSRIATIEQDQDYLSFAEIAYVKKEPPTMAELANYAESLAAKKVQEVQMTPLLSYLNEYRRGGRSNKRSKTSEPKKKRSKESKSTKESRSKSEDIPKSSSSGSKEWGSKSKKEKSGKKYDTVAAPTSDGSVDAKSSVSGSERSRDRGKSREDVRGKHWKESKGRDESSWDGGSGFDRRKGEGNRKEKSTGKMQKNEEGATKDVDQGDKGGYREKKGSRRASDDEHRQKSSSVRNRDRPDQAIYSARSRSRGEINHTSKNREGSSDGLNATKEKGDSYYTSSRSDGWKRRDQVNGEKPKFRSDKGDYYEWDESRYRSGNRRGRGRGTGYSDSASKFHDK